MNIELICRGIVESNCYGLVSGDEVVLIDAGAFADDIISAIERRGLKPRAILLTHGHFDHILGAKTIAEKYASPVYIHERDAEMLGDGYKNAYTVFFGGSWDSFSADKLIGDGERLSFFGENIDVIHTPGHSEGSVCFKWKNNLFTGDTIFSRGTGRCDLYGGDNEKIIRSIDQLGELPADTVIYPGHGISCSLSEAMRYARLI